MACPVTRRRRITRVGLISDTHIPEAAVLPSWTVEALKGAALTLHAGTSHRLGVLRDLEAIAPLGAVRGNSDKVELPDTELVMVDGASIGVVHVRRPVSEVEATFGQAADCLVYGHDHRRTVLQADELLIVSPGSPRKPAPGSQPSVAIPDIADGAVVWAELVRP